MSDAALDRMLIIVHCAGCRRTVRYWAADLMQVVGPHHQVHVPPFACGRCRTMEWMSVRWTIPASSDIAARLIVRRPVRQVMKWIWRDEKTPVIGLGKSAARQTGTLGDFKKRTLFEMIAMEHSYFEQDSTAETETEFYGRVLRECALDPGSGFFDGACFSLMQALTARFRHRLDRLLLAA